MITFGAGVMFGTPLYDGSGNAISVPSPVQFCVLQNVAVDENFEVKKLHGAKSFPKAVARGKGGISIKAQIANFNAELVNTFLFGVTLTSAYQNAYNDLSGSVIPTGAGATSITPTTPTTAVVADLGVVSSVDGVPYTRVSSAPTGGQYSYAGGIWTFADQDVGKTAYVSYVYSASVTGAKKLTVPNQQMGLMPIFSLDLAQKFQGKTSYVRYPNVIAHSFTRSFKNDDFTIYDMAMEAFEDSSGNIYYRYDYE